ncbi:PilZ domain-containing protein, partial [Paraglaciecola sp.]|uniref:PilZ domain-containing protein n=1 Tax=Paraglaciecola sp. TaxID=1920173 RepID=UPI003EFA1C38
SYLAPLIKFGNFAQRDEERMNYSVNIEIFTNQNKSLQANTIDISVNGLKVKASKEHLFKVGERLTIQFRGLEKEYSLNKRQGLIYVIGSIDQMVEAQRLNLKRVDDNPNLPFDNFLKQFIHGNKRRYKVNLDNTINAIQNKAYEQYYIPSFTSIPVYIDKVGDNFIPRYALANDSNREEIQYWANEIQDLKIGYLLTEARIKQALAQPKGHQELFIFVFNHIKNDKVYFYSATNDELDAKPQLKKLFLGYGSRKASWRVYKMQLTKMDPEQSYRPLSISNSINESVKRQNQKPSPRLMSRLKNLKYIAVLTNITDDVSTEQYQKNKISREQLPKLKVFGHPRNKPPAIVTVYRFKYFNQRRETRFLLRTAVIIKVGDTIVNGQTEDISTKGLKIELNKLFIPDGTNRVSLTFPKLQSVTSKFDLTDLPYLVKHTSKDGYVIHLQNFVTEENNTARRFFETLIKANRSKLKAYRDEEEVPGIGEALRNIYSQNIVNTAFFLRKDTNDFVPDASASWSMPSRLSNLLKFKTGEQECNLYPLFRNAKVRHDFIPQTLANIKPNNKPMVKELFIAFDPSKKELSEAVHSYYSNQFTKPEQRRQFIATALQYGQFIAVKVFLARTGRPDFETMQSELNYVSIYALHKAKQLEEQLWSVSAMGDIVDVTDEVLKRFNFDAKVIENNHKTPKKHKIKQMGIEQILKA